MISGHRTTTILLGLCIVRAADKQLNSVWKGSAHWMCYGSIRCYSLVWYCWEPTLLGCCCDKVTLFPQMLSWAVHRHRCTSIVLFCLVYFHIGNPLCDTDAKALQPQSDVDCTAQEPPWIIKNECETWHETLDLWMKHKPNASRMNTCRGTVVLKITLWPTSKIFQESKPNQALLSVVYCSSGSSTVVLLARPLRQYVSFLHSENMQRVKAESKHVLVSAIVFWKTMIRRASHSKWMNWTKECRRIQKHNVTSTQIHVIHRKLLSVLHVLSFRYVRLKNVSTCTIWFFLIISC